MTFADWDELTNLLGELRKQEHLDAEYIFLKLRYDRAFQFVATRSEVSIDKCSVVLIHKGQGHCFKLMPNKIEIVCRIWVEIAFMITIVHVS